MKGKKPSKSALRDKILVNPGDLNSDWSMHGGRLYYLMDQKAATVGRDHSGCVSRTVAFSPGKYFNPVELSDAVIISAKITKSWNTTMEIRVESCAMGVEDEEERDALVLYFYFIAVKNGKPQKVPPVLPQTTEEKEEYDRADGRRAVVIKFIDEEIERLLKRRRRNRKRRKRR